ncbi:ABC transporter ATP-binding protein [Haladaptatus sp. NG-WS-4]
MTTIEVDGLTKRFGRAIGIQDVSFRVEDGERVGLFGPNGAGKTTILRILATLATPTRGRVLVDGDPLTPDNAAIRSRIGVVSHDTMLYEGLTARENLRLHARVHGVDDGRCERVLELVGLGAEGSSDPSEFSHGMRQRLSFARALLHEPDVLLLDEPYSGLDRRTMADFHDALDAVGARTVVMATHDLERGFTHCDRGLVLDGGTVRRDVAFDEFETSTDFVDCYRRTLGLEETA